MPLRLYFHPLSSYCHKVLIALYENGTRFEPVSVNLGDETERAALLKLWPVGKFPVLRDDERNAPVCGCWPWLSFAKSSAETVSARPNCATSRPCHSPAMAPRRDQ